MEIRIERNELLAGLTKIQTIVEKKSTMPIISNVLFDAADGQLSLIATDLEIILKAEYPAEIIEGGKITVSARKVYEIVREIPSSNITLKQKEGSRLSIMSGKIAYNLVGLPAEQFPTLPAHDDVKVIEVDSKALKELINKTIFCVSIEDTRYNLCGINVEKTEGPEAEDKRLRMVSSDGHRLCLMETYIEGVDNLDLNFGVILPRKGAREILRMCDSNEKVMLGFKEKTCLVKADSMLLIMRLIDGEFPDYKAIIPAGGSKKVIVARQPLLEVLRRTSILATEKYKAVSFNFSDGKLEIISVNPDIGDAKEELEIDYQGEQFSINFNMHYLIENLEVIKSEELSMEMENESSPCMIKGAEDKGFLGIVMPMKV